MKNLLIVGLLSGVMAACGGAPAPVAGPAPVAADNGQPRMQAALQALQNAQTEANAAEANKGGHREKALEHIAKAIEATNAGMQYAASHANEAGAPEGPAEAEPVDEEVKGAGGQPHMRAAVVQLREARKQLKDAKHDKGGFREEAMHQTNEAIKQLRDGIRFADHHE